MRLKPPTVAFGIEGRTSPKRPWGELTHVSVFGEVINPHAVFRNDKGDAPAATRRPDRIHTPAANSQPQCPSDRIHSQQWT